MPARDTTEIVYILGDDGESGEAFSDSWEVIAKGRASIDRLRSQENIETRVRRARPFLTKEDLIESATIVQESTKGTVLIEIVAAPNDHPPVIDACCRASKKVLRA
jgi:hypothetical protein